MLGAADWSILDLEAGTADVVAAAVSFDDGAIDAVDESAGGIAPLLALSIDGAGNNAWRWQTVAIEVEGPLLDLQGFLFELSAETATDEVLQAAPGALDHVVATVEATVDGPRLVDVEAGSDLASDLAAYPGPACGRSEAFVLADLAEGRCPLPELDGARVVLELR